MRRKAIQFFLRWVDRIGTCKQRGCCSLGQGDPGLTGTESVAASGLAPAFFDRMPDIFTPLAFVIVASRVRHDPKLPVRRRSELKTHFVVERPSVGLEVMFCSWIAFGFAMEVSIFNIHSHGDSHVTFIRKIA